MIGQPQISFFQCIQQHVNSVLDTVTHQGRALSPENPTAVSTSVCSAATSPKKEKCVPHVCRLIQIHISSPFNVWMHLEIGLSDFYSPSECGKHGHALGRWRLIYSWLRLSSMCVRCSFRRHLNIFYTCKKANEVLLDLLCIKLMRALIFRERVVVGSEQVFDNLLLTRKLAWESKISTTSKCCGCRQFWYIVPKTQTAVQLENLPDEITWNVYSTKENMAKMHVGNPRTKTKINHCLFT